MFIKKRTLIILTTLILIINGVLIYSLYFSKPRNSLELYQAIAFADDFEQVQNLNLAGYEDNFKKEDFDYIKSEKSIANSISQMTLFAYDEKTYVIMTSPGTRKLKILTVEELPKDIRDYFSE
ncbi:hypothetical protein AUO94_01475 [Planococcus kocurii]|uniref:Uncharacterized protein n=1 Tax=Planococcus kocurii TaxID=1374 RepID=A0ABM5WT24_9BACL|nr:hypothetical protein [Planococcus kocurii]ALS77393.1 hypothetical protein AUO94_01475 [Planococcus kocurii]